MPATTFACVSCGATLRIAETAPAAKRIRCPVCQVIFDDPRSASSRDRSSERGLEFNCKDCGTVLRLEEPLQAGQLVQCSQCTTIFRVPADGTIFGRDRRPTRQSTNAPAYFEPWTPRTKKREEISTGQPVAADLPVVKLQASLYGVKPDPPIDAQLVKPWEPVPDEALIESRRGERSARARKRIAIIAGIIAAVCCLAIVVVLIIVFRQPTP